MKPLPVTVKGRRSRTTIVAAAAHLMYLRGIAATTIDDVLEASGTGKSQLYHYFDGKQDLTLAVLQYQFGRVMASQPSLGKEDSDDLGQWRDEVLRAQQRSDFGQCALGVFTGQVGGDPVLRAELTALFGEWQDAIGGLVRRALAARRIRSGVDPVSTSLALLTAVQGGTLLGHMSRDDAPLTEALDRVLGELLPARGDRRGRGPTGRTTRRAPARL